MNYLIEAIVQIDFVLEELHVLNGESWWYDELNHFFARVLISQKHDKKVDQRDGARKLVKLSTSCCKQRHGLRWWRRTRHLWWHGNGSFPVQCGSASCLFVYWIMLELVERPKCWFVVVWEYWMTWVGIFRRDRWDSVLVDDQLRCKRWRIVRLSRMDFEVCPIESGFS